MATFKGQGIVKWKGKTLVNFTEHNGRFTTSDEMIIQRLKLLDFKAEPDAAPAPQLPTTKTTPAEQLAQNIAAPDAEQPATQGPTPNPAKPGKQSGNKGKKRK